MVRLELKNSGVRQVLKYKAVRTPPARRDTSDVRGRQDTYWQYSRYREVVGL